jgi:tetratricopeptide (TPR) repeat protein
MNKLKQLSNNRFLLISSDKGYSSLEELDHMEHPELTFHGNCFSIMVNFHALSQYAKLMQGDFKVQAFRDYIISGVFTVGFTMTKMPMLNAAAFEMTDRFSPVDYFELYKNVERNYKQSTLEEMLSFLNLSNWDSRLFALICDRLVELSENADPDTLMFLLKNIPNIADNFYYFPNCTDVYFNIAIVYQGVHSFEDAILYYKKSIDMFGESDVVLFNVAMCYYSLDQKSNALRFLKRALRVNPNLPQIKEMIKAIEGGE